MQDWEQIRKAIAKAESIMLFTHIHSDGDCLGSSFALAYFLCGLGKRVVIINEEIPPKNLHFIYETECKNADCEENGNNLPVPDFYVWDMPGYETLLSESYDLSIAIDVSDVKRLGDRRELFYKAKETARIDHHITTESFADLTVCNPEWAATAEGIWEYICQNEKYKESPYIKEVAKCVYAGILTDTGCFAYSNVTAETHLIAADLTKIAGNMAWQYSEVYENQSKSEIALKAIAFGKLEYYGEGKIAYLHITKEEMESVNATDDDLSGFAPFLRCIENVSIGVLVKPGKNPGQYRLSLRSDSHCDVNAVASCFGGGGHKRAAGVVYNPESGISFVEFKEKLIGKILKWME